MRIRQQREVLECVDSLRQAHLEIKRALHQKNNVLAQNMISECQEFAMTLGEVVERAEGEGHITVSYIEKYCEILFHIFESINNQCVDENKVFKSLKKQLIRVENSIKNDIKLRREVVFFPYKASMWDSLESVYLAAKEDLDCDVYCVPIPYYDLQTGHSLGQMHYEGGKYPKNIEVTDWKLYNFEERKPDVIYIHNPYDEYNLVTSIHPRYYSSNLKKYTDVLVYIPYYSSSGKMSAAQSLCPAYLYADYIVIQSPQFQKYFNPVIAQEKFLPLGSPKFDSVIHKCQNPPKLPKEWKEKMSGKKVYFYNTSITGMLENTENFLKKMEYVFKCFADRTDVCLLWRPHPLLETTFDSMRPEYRIHYEELKKEFINRQIGILDDTSDIEDSIAWSDAYIGDSGTSVISLFGVAGKPSFILDNTIHCAPEENSWRKKNHLSFDQPDEDGYRYMIAQSNNLYKSEPYQFDYHFFCNLSGSLCDESYLSVYEINSQEYICPLNAQNILVLGEAGVERRIELRKEIVKGNAFGAAWKYENYLLLVPSGYPAIVRYDTISGEIKYFYEKIDSLTKENGAIGGSYLYEGILYIASSVDSLLYLLHIDSGESQVIKLPLKNKCGFGRLAMYKKDLWLLPYEGAVILRWNTKTGDTREYTGLPGDFTNQNRKSKTKCENIFFNVPYFYGDHAYFSPVLANMYLELNLVTGEFTRWKPPFEEEMEQVNSFFLRQNPKEAGRGCKMYSFAKGRLYNINMETQTCEEIELKLDKEEFQNHEPGFCEYSGNLRYVCMENEINTLDCFLNGNISGNQFDCGRQLRAYREISSNFDGRCGEKIHNYIKKVLE